MKKHHFLMVLVVYAAYVSFSIAADFNVQKYIGTTVPPDNPGGVLANDGIKWGGGSLPWAKTDPDLIVEWAEHNGSGMAWLVKRVPPPKNIIDQQCCWNYVFDILVSPPLNPKEKFFDSDCTIKGKVDHGIVAITSEETDKAGHCLFVRKAWKANRKALKFEAISTKDLQCTPVIDD